MGSDFKVVFNIFILLSTVYLINASDDLKDESLDRGAHDRSGLWFGPRLGKRSIQFIDEDKSDSFSKLLEAADTLKYYYDELPYQMQADVPRRVARKLKVTLKKERPVGSKKRIHYDFTPRLGRRLHESIPDTSPEEDVVFLP